MFISKCCRICKISPRRANLSFSLLLPLLIIYRRKFLISSWINERILRAQYIKIIQILHTREGLRYRDKVAVLRASMNHRGKCAEKIGRLL